MPLSEQTEKNDADRQWERLKGLAAPEDRPSLEAAYHLARRAHHDQWRKVAAGAQPIPYIVHPLKVACIVAEEWRQNDLRTLQVCLLHDVLEDCDESLRMQMAEEICALAGKEVHDAVWTLTKPAPAPAEVKAARDARYFAELRHAPQWVRLVKCADRVDNLRDACAWGDPAFWKRYSSETIGWHLYLARETAPIAEVALFGALVAGEREIHGRVPVWVDGHLVDPSAAALIPEAISRQCQVVGVALRGDHLVLGMLDPTDKRAVETVRALTHRKIERIHVSADGLRDAQAAGLYGRAE